MVPRTAQTRLAPPNQTDVSSRLFVLWTLFVVFCQCAGWGLSALHALNAAGYIVAFTIFVIAAAIWWRTNPIASPSVTTIKLKRRFKRPFPLAFLLLTLLAILGGALYPPNNFDALAYRTPRVLSWLAEDRWHWIHSHFGNLNSRGAGFEWTTAPIFALFKTDRPVFLINVICFLFLPGRVFAALTQFGIRPRTAYYWMWIYPTAYGFLLQAGSVGNDLFSALWPIAAFEFALRARRTKRVEWLWLSILAAALMTASKAFNLLLLPAWGIAILPSLQLLLRRPAASIAVIAIAAGGSMIPTAILNFRNCGDWTGMAVEPVSLNNGPPIFEFCVNAVLVPLQNFSPPIFPFSDAWNAFVTRILPTSLAAQLNRYFESDAARFRIPELQAEELAGLGFGVSVLLLLIVLRQLRLGRRVKSSNLFSLRNLVALAALCGAAIYMAKSGLYAPARYLLPHSFAILLPIFALPAAAELTRKRWWRAVAIAMFALATLPLILSPARPLWPAQTLLRILNQTPSPLLQRAEQTYAVYRERPTVLRPIRDALPPNTSPVGFISLNNPETSLWQPFGSRRVLHIRREDSPEFMRQRGIQYIVVGPNIMGQIFKTTPEQWAQINRGEIVQRFKIQMLARGAPDDWVLIRLKP